MHPAPVAVVLGHDSAGVAAQKLRRTAQRICQRLLVHATGCWTEVLEVKAHDDHGGHGGHDDHGG